jgi:hypothetical protein
VRRLAIVFGLIVLAAGVEQILLRGDCVRQVLFAASENVRAAQR